MLVHDHLVQLEEARYDNEARDEMREVGMLRLSFLRNWAQKP